MRTAYPDERKHVAVTWIFHVPVSQNTFCILCRCLSVMVPVLCMLARCHTVIMAYLGLGIEESHH